VPFLILKLAAEGWGFSEGWGIAETLVKLLAMLLLLYLEVGVFSCRLGH